MYRSLVSHWPEPTVVVPGAVEPPTALDTVQAGALSTIEHMSLVDQLTYLPDDILVKVDRAAMACSLETRVPLLDHRVVEFAWALPMHQKIRGGVGKWLLRQVLYQDVPRELFERPKQGFAIPLDRWLRGPLRDWAEALLDPARLRNEGWFDAPTLQNHWRQHLRGERNWQYPLWDALMFQAWLQAQAAPPPAPAAPRIAPAAPGVLA
jgi:asparagine synthase (glutamine-hydrolysing)